MEFNKSLKENGALMYFVPLEKRNFFHAREKVMKEPKWQEVFKHFSITPLRYSPEEYYKPFASIFSSENCKGISGAQPMQLDEKGLKKFMSSLYNIIKLMNFGSIDSIPR